VVLVLVSPLLKLVCPVSHLQQHFLHPFCSPQAGTVLTLALALASAHEAQVGVVLVLVSPLLRHSLLSLPLEAKLILVPISPTIATMTPHGLRFRLGLGLLTWFLSTRLPTRLVLTCLLTFFTKEHFLGSAHKLDRLLEIICLWRKHGWSWGFV
jgi:hypothetical protein